MIFFQRAIRLAQHHLLNNNNVFPLTGIILENLKLDSFEEKSRMPLVQGTQQSENSNKHVKKYSISFLIKEKQLKCHSPPFGWQTQKFNTQNCWNKRHVTEVPNCPPERLNQFTIHQLSLRTSVSPQPWPHSGFSNFLMLATVMSGKINGMTYFSMFISHTMNKNKYLFLHLKDINIFFSIK